MFPPEGEVRMPRRPKHGPADPDDVDPPTEVHSARESNAEMEGARAPGGGPDHGREAPPGRGNEPGADDAVPVPVTFTAHLVTCAQPTRRSRADTVAAGAPPRSDDASR